MQILQRMRAAGEAERTRTMSGKPGMLPEARSLLREFYSDWNDRLAFLLRDRRFLWAETQPRRL